MGKWMDMMTTIEDVNVTQEMLAAPNEYEYHIFRNCTFPNEPFELFARKAAVRIENCKNVGMLRFLGRDIIIKDCGDITGARFCGYGQVDASITLTNVSGNIVLDTDTMPNDWVDDEDFTPNYYDSIIINTKDPITVTVEDSRIEITDVEIEAYHPDSDVMDLILQANGCSIKLRDTSKDY